MFHGGGPSGNREKFDQLDDGSPHQPPDRHHGDHLTKDLEPIRLEDPVHKPENRKCNQPPVSGSGNSVESKHPLMSLRQKRIFYLLQPKAKTTEKVLQYFGGLGS